jgi:hypothetical protein
MRRMDRRDQECGEDVPSVNQSARPLRLGLFGASRGGEHCLQVLQRDPRFVVESFFDNDPAKWGAEIRGVPVARPTRKACRALDGVVITSVYEREILGQLARFGCKRVVSGVAGLYWHVAAPSQELDENDGGSVADAQTRLHDELLAQVPRHVVDLADRIDLEPEAASSSTAAWIDEAACTICCNNYIAQAMVLARSFLRHHPQGRFYIGLADRRSAGVPYPEDPRIQVIEAHELGIDGFDAFAFKYTVLEFSTAIKPYLLTHLFRREPVHRLLYLDPDILVLASLSPLFDTLSDTPLVLTPHMTRPYTDDRHPNEIDVLRSGTYNLGFIGLARHDQTWDFLAWWQQRVYDGCAVDLKRGYFTDQKWIDLVPSFFPGHRIIRDPGYNAAYWNLHEREIAIVDGRFHSNGQPLRFFHFSGMDLVDVARVSKHQDRYVLPASGALRDLFELYRLLLLRHEHLKFRSIPYAYGEFENGVRVPDVTRKVFRESKLSRAFPGPFTVDGRSGFFDWLRERSRPDAAITNLLAEMHACIPDLAKAFPDLYGTHLASFLVYMVVAGPVVYGLPPELTDIDVHDGLPQPA